MGTYSAHEFALGREGDVDGTVAELLAVARPHDRSSGGDRGHFNVALVERPAVRSVPVQLIPTQEQSRNDVPIAEDRYRESLGRKSVVREPVADLLDRHVPGDLMRRQHVLQGGKRDSRCRFGGRAMR